MVNVNYNEMACKTAVAINIRRKIGQVRAKFADREVEFEADTSRCVKSTARFTASFRALEISVARSLVPTRKTTERSLLLRDVTSLPLEKVR